MEARVVRGRGDRRAPERALRLHQGRSRGAPRRRRRLHERRAGLTGGGGWPMSVWLTAGPRAVLRRHLLSAARWDRGARRHGLPDLARRAVRQLYRKDPARVARRGGAGWRPTGPARPRGSRGARRRPRRRPRIAGALPTRGPSPAPRTLLKRAFDTSPRRLPAARPSFPRAVPVRAAAALPPRAPATRRRSRMATLTLEKMAAGGIYDQLGGGFHRYCHRRAWLVPHFEKMLYDNALLAVAYLEAFQVTGRARLRARRARDARLRPARDDRARRRLLLGDRRRLRGRGGEVLRLDAGRDCAALLGRDARSLHSRTTASPPGELRGPQHPARSAPRRGSMPR